MLSGSSSEPFFSFSCGLVSSSLAPWTKGLQRRPNRRMLKLIWAVLVVAILLAITSVKHEGNLETGVGLEGSRVMVLGLGYVGLAVASSIRRQWPDVQVSATCRNPHKAGILRAHGIPTYVYSSGEKASWNLTQALRSATHVLVCIPPGSQPPRDGRTDPVCADVSPYLRENEKLEWVGYVSTTGVYGDHSGEWVDETAETRVPENSKLGQRKKAEEEWISSLPSVTHIFRLSGIYGPGRSIFASLGIPEKSSNANSNLELNVNKTLPAWVSRVHVYDISHSLINSMQDPRPNTIYNLADDEPASRETVLRFAISILDQMPEDVARYEIKREGKSGKSRPETSGSRGNRLRGNKRVLNSRLKKDLLPSGLKYPSYRQGLRAIVRGDVEPFDKRLLPWMELI